MDVVNQLDTPDNGSSATHMNHDSIWPIRSKNGEMQLATHRYEHPDAKRTIWLTGMMHMADEAFYTELRQDLCKQEADGVEIQYELVRKAEDREITVLPPGEMLALGLSRQYSRIVLCELADMSGLSAQYMLDPPDTWLNADITEAELVHLLGAKAALTHAKRVRLIARLATYVPRFARPLIGWLLRQAVQLVFPDANTMEQVHEQGRRAKDGAAGVIVDHRNERALKYLLSSVNPRVHATWGGGHVPGIHQGLLESGFMLAETTWRTAIKQ